MEFPCLVVVTFVFAILLVVEPCSEDKFNKCYQEVVCKHLDCTNLPSFLASLYDYFINETQFPNADSYCSLADEYSQCFGDLKAMDECTVEKLNTTLGGNNELLIRFYEHRKSACLDPEIMQIVFANFDCQRSATLNEQERLLECDYQYRNFTGQKAEELYALPPAPLSCSDHQGAIDCQTQVFVDYCGEKSRRDLCTVLRAHILKGITSPMPEDCELHC